MTHDNQARFLKVFVTICVLFMAQFVLLLSHDLFNAEQDYPMGWEYRGSYSYWTTMGHFIILMFMAVPAIIWHIADVWHRREPKNWALRTLSSYGLLLAILLYGIAGLSILVSGVLYYLHCPENDPNSNFFILCHADSSNGMFPLLFLPILGLLALAALKIILAFSSRTVRGE